MNKARATQWLAPWRRRVARGPRGSLTTQRKAGARVVAAPLKRFVWWCWGGLLFHATCTTVAPLLVFLFRASVPIELHHVAFQSTWRLAHECKRMSVQLAWALVPTMQRNRPQRRARLEHVEGCYHPYLGRISAAHLFDLPLARAC